MNYKLSIITINYNDVTGLTKTINSVLNQTWQEFEYIVIDGGSNDGSKALIESFSDNICYWVSEKDTGVYNAMNKGIKQASGKYLLFLNSGDTLYDNFTLENIYTYLNENEDNDILYGNSAFYKQNKFERNFIPPKKLSFIYFFNSSLNHQATFIKKSLFEENFYYNEEYKICSDWEFFMYNICIKKAKYHYIDAFICNYDVSGISSNPQTNHHYINEREQTLKKFFPYLEDDFDKFKDLGDKRVKNILHIKKFNWAWKFLKSVAKFLMLFLPKRVE